MQSKTSSSGGDNGNQDALDVGALAGSLRSTLGLPLPPVAIAFVTQPPEGIPAFAGQVPSACALWRHAEERLFFAPAETHYNCLIGAMTMGFPMSEAQSAQLTELVGQICAIGYVESDEPARIPSVDMEKSGIVYGPLASFPMEPDVVLVWVSAASAMRLAEATGTSRWTAEQRGASTFGRPSCGAIPAAIRQSMPAFSLGCTGMRVFTGIDESLQLTVLPRAVLAGLCERLEAVATVNAQMAEYYAAQLARIAPHVPAT
jgi:uncharacterized protein (DUF169 family)